MFHHAALRLLFVRGAPDPAGHGQIVAHFFDSGLSRTLAWARRPQAATLVAQLANRDRGWDAVVNGAYRSPLGRRAVERTRRCCTAREARSIARHVWLLCGAGRPE